MDQLHERLQEIADAPDHGTASQLWRDLVSTWVPAPKLNSREDLEYDPPPDSDSLSDSDSADDMDLSWDTDTEATSVEGDEETAPAEPVALQDDRGHVRGYALAGPERNRALFGAAQDALPWFPDAFVLAAHMTADGQQVVLANGIELDAAQFLRWLQDLPGYRPGMPLVLVMCKAG